METGKSGANHTDLNAKSAGVVWDPYRLVILIQKSLFCIQKSQRKSRTQRDEFF